DDGLYAATSLAAKVQGPRAIRRLLARLHGADDLGTARTLQASLGEGESVITRAGERLGDGWVRIARSGAAKQGALLREKEIQTLRGDIEQHQHRERELDTLLTELRDTHLAADQQREDAQRQLYMAHRSVSELAGQLQSQQGRLENARNRIARIDAELAQLGETLEASKEQAAEARIRIDDALGRMGNLESARQTLENERRYLTDKRETARAAAREARDAAHALALALESQRVQVVALSQALERMG
ncbi:TPA: hypothetical protein ACLNKM_003657, partial [Vibrio cholerae O1]